MVGAPPGYVGFEEGGQLTEYVRRKPYSVVLFDEIEKAHPDVFNMMLQILDDGRLTDGQGRTVNFRNSVIIMTSNIGSAEIGNSGPIGFSVTAKDAPDHGLRTKLLEILRRTFRPEFLNRVDDIIVFNSLSREHLVKIIDLQLSRVGTLLEARGIHLEVTQAAKDVLMTEGYDQAYGARPMKRAIQRMIQDPLSLRLLSGDFVQGDTVVVEGDTAKHALEFTRRVAEPVTQ
jgi:ATP-dependent Clp protease ATP-binding subunit ClpA